MILMLAFGMLLIPLFVIYEIKLAKVPVIDVRMFKIRNIPIACAMNFLNGAAYFGAIVFLPRFFIVVKGSSLLTSALDMLALVLFMGISSLLAAHSISHSGKFRLVALVGASSYAFGAALILTVESSTPSANAIAYSVFIGIGAGIIFIPAVILGPMSCKPSENASVNGFLSFLRTLGGATAVILFSDLLETGFTHTLRGQIPDGLLQQGIQLADEQALYPQYRNQIVQAFTQGYRLTNVPAVAIGALFALFLLALPDVDKEPACVTSTAEPSEKKPAEKVAENPAMDMRDVKRIRIVTP
jgi:MFS family permease